MPSLPPSVRESWGEQVADDFSHWLEQLLEERAVHRDEYREVISRLDVLEERFDLMEEHVDNRIDQMEARFDERLVQMEKRFNERFEQVDQRFEQVDKRFEGIDTKLDRMNDRILSMTRWLIGLIALFGTLVTALLGVAQFIG